MSNQSSAVLKPRVVKGTRYGGANQRLYAGEPDPAKLKDRATAFVPPEKRKLPRLPPPLVNAAAEERRKAQTLPPITKDDIAWEPGTSLPTLLVNGRALLEIAKHRVKHYPSRMNRFYGALIERLRQEKYARPVRFHVRAQGKYPAKEGESAITFIKMFAQGDEFILPKSFLQDCNGAFIAECPIDE